MERNDVIREGREVLLASGVDPREARLLLAFILNVRKEALDIEKECSNDEYREFIKIINRRASGEPFAYLVGKKEFMGLEFKVDESVLIPRSDTEILVETILQIYKDYDKIDLLDLCTGSGCIAVSLAKYLENAKVTAGDISAKALEIAKKNAINNLVHVKFVLSDLFEKIEGKYDVIVSNPPYIQTEVIKSLEKEVKKEPILALDGGKTGLDFYEKITEKSQDYLKSGGILAFEIGYDQGYDVSNMMRNNGFKNIIVKKDLNGNDRVVIGKYQKGE